MEGPYGREMVLTRTVVLLGRCDQALELRDDLRQAIVEKPPNVVVEVRRVIGEGSKEARLYEMPLQHLVDVLAAPGVFPCKLGYVGRRSVG